MPSCCSGFRCTADGHFSVERARRDLQRYRRKGPGPTTRLLSDGLVTTGVDGLLLDIGTGVGSLAFELLDRGVTRAIAVDASSAFIAAAREEAQRRGRLDAVEFIHGDFVALAADLPTATTVTLDRVVCCYPDVEALLEEALRHAGKRLAFTYPRDRWYVRAGFALENRIRRVRRNPFRTFVHSPALMERIVTRAGFVLQSRRQTRTWSSDVYLRRP